LNRLYLDAQEQKYKDKHPERPPLSSCNTAKDVKRWIPNIKWEINFCLHHLSGIRNYPDYKIREFEQRVEKLKGEYKRWVKKALELDPDTIGVPGNLHAYHSKRTVQDAKKRRQMVHTMNPNGFNHMYQPKEEELEKELHLDEEFEETDYYKDIDKYALEAGLLGNEGEFTAQDDGEAIETPLAKRPDGYVSEDEESEEIQEPLDPNDPQNQPLSFGPKSLPFSDTKKRKADELGGQTTPSTKATTSSTTGLTSLLSYQSDSEGE